MSRAALLAILLLPTPLLADWPQWRGPARDGLDPQSPSLVQQLPEEATSRKQRAAIGAQALQHARDIDAAAARISMHLAAAQLVLGRNPLRARRQVDRRVRRDGEDGGGAHAAFAALPSRFSVSAT